jgi:hypothetical protein
LDSHKTRAEPSTKIPSHTSSPFGNVGPSR